MSCIYGCDLPAAGLQSAERGSELYLHIAVLHQLRPTPACSVFSNQVLLWGPGKVSAAGELIKSSGIPQIFAGCTSNWPEYASS